MKDKELIYRVLNLFDTLTLAEWDNDVKAYLKTDSEYWKIDLIYKNINLTIKLIPLERDFDTIEQKNVVEITVGVTNKGYEIYALIATGYDLSYLELEYIKGIYYKIKGMCDYKTMKEMIEKTVNDYFESKGITNDDK